MPQLCTLQHPSEKGEAGESDVEPGEVAL
jgi:hypothetical protein